MPAAWRLFCQDRILRRGLDAAARLHREGALQAQALAAWRQRAAACRQLDLPAQHPTMRAAAELRRRRVLRACLGAWRRHVQEEVLPRMAAVQVRLLELMMGSQRQALQAWKEYVQHRRERRVLKVGWAGGRRRDPCVGWASQMAAGLAASAFITLPVPRPT